MSFNREELEKMQDKGLKRLADYLNVSYDSKTSKGKIIDGIMAELSRRSEPYRDYNTMSSAVAPEVPRYSVRIQRIMQSKLEGEAK